MKNAWVAWRIGRCHGDYVGKGFSSSVAMKWTHLIKIEKERRCSVCTVSGNMTNRGAVSEPFYLEVPYFNMGITYQTKAKWLSEMSVTTKKP